MSHTQPICRDTLKIINQKGDKKMTYTLACKDFGGDCPYVAQGNTFEEVLEEGKKHAKEVHDYTDEQVNAPEFAEQSKALVKQT